MANVYDLKHRNLNRIRECFFAKELWSVNELMNETGLSHGAVVNCVKTLEEEGEIILSRKSGSSVGRKTYLYTLNPDYAYFGMVFVGRNRETETIRYTSLIADLAGGMRNEKITESGTYDLHDLEKVMDELLEEEPKIRMILISSPGVCSNGTIRNLPYFEIDAKAIIERKYAIEWAVENDVNTACIGFHSLHPECRDLAFVYQAASNVFGCGMMIHGELYNGFANAAGELRYFPFMKYAENKNADELLREQVLSVAALMNPELIGYYSEVSGSEIDLSRDLPENVLPAIIRADDLLSLEKKGLYAVLKQRFIKQRGGVL